MFLSRIINFFHPYSVKIFTTIVTINLHRFADYQSTDSGAFRRIAISDELGRRSVFPTAFICIWCQRSCTYEICFRGRDKNIDYRKIHNGGKLRSVKGLKYYHLVRYLSASCSRSSRPSLSSRAHHGRSKPAGWTFLSTRCFTPPGQWNGETIRWAPVLSAPLCFHCIGPWLHIV